MSDNGTSHFDDGFYLAIEHTPLHIHPRLTPSMGMLIVRGIYSIFNRNPAYNNK